MFPKSSPVLENIVVDENFFSPIDMYIRGSGLQYQILVRLTFDALKLLRTAFTKYQPREKEPVATPIYSTFWSNVLRPDPL